MPSSPFESAVFHHGYGLVCDMEKRHVHCTVNSSNHQQCEMKWNWKKERKNQQQCECCFTVHIHIHPHAYKQIFWISVFNRITNTCSSEMLLHNRMFRCTQCKSYHIHMHFLNAFKSLSASYNARLLAIARIHRNTHSNSKYIDEMIKKKLKTAVSPTHINREFEWQFRKTYVVDIVHCIVLSLSIELTHSLNWSQPHWQ